MAEISPGSSGLACGWTLTHPGHYLVWCVVGAIAVRAVHSAFKALSAGQGSYDAADKERNSSRVQCEPSRWTWLESFQAAFWPFRTLDALNDLGLGFLIGLAEIASYPVLTYTDNMSAVGWWTALKIAGGWTGWKDKPTALNRFLLSNLLTMGIAYSLMLRYVQGIPK